MNFYRPKRDGVKVKVVETGMIFSSVRECAEYFEVSPTYISKIISDPDRCLACKGFHVIKLNDRIPDYKHRKENRGRPGKKVEVLETGKCYDSISECAKNIDGSSGSIHDAMHNNRNRSTHKGFHFKEIT